MRSYSLKEYGGTIYLETPHGGSYLIDSSLKKGEKYCVAFNDLFMRMEKLEDEVTRLRRRINELEAE